MKMSWNPSVLIPTELELEISKRNWAARGVPLVPTVQCGFGLVTSGIQTARLFQTDRPDHVFLLGIAGAYSMSNTDGALHTTVPLHVGQAYIFHRVSYWGIGVGQGADFQSAESLGWHDPSHSPTTLKLQYPPTAPPNSEIRELLSVTSASHSFAEAESKRHHFPQAVAEDMEGYAVALACHLAGIPLTIIRGISNVAGDRVKSRWQIEPALLAGLDCLRQALDYFGNRR